MLTFYVIAGGLAILASVLLVRPLVAGRTAGESRDARDAQVFRDQLAEIERDLARGTIGPDEAEGARIEVSRRLIAADQRARRAETPRPAPQGHSGLVAGLALVGTPALAAGLYLALGAPGLPDQPLASRPDAIAALGGAPVRPAQAEAEAAMSGREPATQRTPDPQYAAMVEQLESVLENRPDDLQGNRLLANGLMNLGRYGQAWRTYDRVIELSGGTADAETHASKAEGMILAAGGYVSPEAEAEIARALQLDPSLPIARYYSGLALRQAGRTDEAAEMWQALRRDSPADAPYLPWLDAMLAEARPRGAPAAGISGPTQADIAAADQLSAEERSAMIDDMVARLDERLRSNGGTAGEWIRLMASNVTLGRSEAAADAYTRALAALDSAGDQAVRAQAERLGIGAEVGAAAPAPPVRRAAPAPTVSEPVRGETRAGIADAGQMSPDDRAGMDDSMVARLESRLTRQGGSAEEWLRLVEAYARLDRRDEAARVYRLAAEALKGDPAAGFVKEQAMLLGVAVE